MFKKLKAYLPLFSISFATLFFELLIIRWSGAEIKVLAFFKNIVLMAVLVGLGLGCAKPLVVNREKAINDRFWFVKEPVSIFSFLFVILCAIFSLAPSLGLANMHFVVSTITFEMVGGELNSIYDLGVNVLKILALYLTIVLTFDNLGAILAQELRDKKPLPAYSANLLGSLAGTLAFSLTCLLQLPPTFWIVIGFASIACFFWESKMGRAIFCFCLAASLLLCNQCVGKSLWSPYYRIDTKPYMSEGNLPYKLGDYVYVNHDFICRTIDLSQTFLEQHPEVRESKEFFHYSLPYPVLNKVHNVLIIGAGPGNDVASALRHDVDHIDAVEIDPVIEKFGERMHPEDPYHNKKVTIYIDDARAFLSKTKSKYDLVDFSLLDAHTALSIASSVRLDNYLYTKEALDAATKLLSPSGIAMISFAAPNDWLKARLFQLVRGAHKGPGEPICLDTHVYHNGLTFFWGSGLERIRKPIEEKYASLMVPPGKLMSPVELTTDDWPFLYNKSRELPPFYAAVFGLLWLLSFFLIYLRFRFTPQQFLSNGQFFFLGASFLLLETRGLLSTALLFGSTWFVNSLMFATVLLMALVANWCAQKYSALVKAKYCYAGVFASLIFIYLCPLHNLITLPFALKFTASVIILGLPFLFSGLLFSKAFSNTVEPNVALGINILGALLGGCLEYTSLIVGVNNLLILAALGYFLSFLSSKSESAKA